MVTLPRFASTAYKDPRAPQNLVPIAGLERRLRGMLGDGRLLHRALTLAAHRTPARCLAARFPLPERYDLGRSRRAVGGDPRRPDRAGRRPGGVVGDADPGRARHAAAAPVPATR